jgi:hypothetical protein
VILKGKKKIIKIYRTTSKDFLNDFWKSVKSDPKYNINTFSASDLTLLNNIANDLITYALTYVPNTCKCQDVFNGIQQWYGRPFEMFNPKPFDPNVIQNQVKAKCNDLCKPKINPILIHYKNPFIKKIMLKRR